MKVIILGKNGQLGVELEKRAKKLHHKVFAFGRKELDISNENSVRKKITSIKPDLVINASAFHVVPECENFPEEAFKINAICLKNISTICKNINSVFVTFSSDYVFDGYNTRANKEDDKPNPLQ